MSRVSVRADSAPSNNHKMAWTPRLKLAQKGILIVVLPLLIQSLVYMTLKSQLAMAEQQAKTQELSKRIVASISMTVVDTGTLFGALVLYYTDRDAKSAKPLHEGIALAARRIKDLSDLLGNDAHDPQEARVIYSLGNRFLGEVKKVEINASREAPTASVLEQFETSLEFRQIAGKLSDELQRIAKVEESRVLGANEQEQTFRQQFNYLLDAAVALNALLALGLGLFFVRGTVSDLAVLKDNAWRLAADQPLREQIKADDEIGEVDQVFHAMAKALKEGALRERQMIETLQASEEQLKSVINNVPVALVVANEAGQIESLNPTAEQLFCYTSKQLIDERITRLLNVKDKDVDSSAFLQRLREETVSKPVQMEGVSSDHEIIPVEVTVTKFDTSAGSRILATINDVTERYKLERLKREFVAMVSHDIRTPLTSIRGIIELVNNGRLGKVSDEACAKLTVADNNVSRLLHMVTKLLDLDKLDAGHVALTENAFELSRLFDATLPMVAQQAKEHSVNIDVVPSSFRAFGDMDLLVQVLTSSR